MIMCRFCEAEADVDWEPCCGHVIGMCGGCWGAHVMMELLTSPCPDCGIREVQPDQLDVALGWWMGGPLKVLAHA